MYRRKKKWGLLWVPKSYKERAYKIKRLRHLIAARKRRLARMRHRHRRAMYHQRKRHMRFIYHLRRRHAHIRRQNAIQHSRNMENLRRRMRIQWAQWKRQARASQRAQLRRMNQQRHQRDVMIANLRNRLTKANTSWQKRYTKMMHRLHKNYRQARIRRMRRRESERRKRINRRKIARQQRIWRERLARRQRKFRRRLWKRRRAFLRRMQRLRRIYLKNRRKRRRIRRAKYFYMKTLDRQNKKIMEATMEIRQHMAGLAMHRRKIFDQEKEKRVRRAAELWNRAFVMDVVLAVERDLYKLHRKRIKKDLRLHELHEKDMQEKVNNYYVKKGELEQGERKKVLNPVLEVFEF
ncbi:MAG: hypothetical protein AAFO91_02650 [Bacteroidota bacterium]